MLWEAPLRFASETKVRDANKKDLIMWLLVKIAEPTRILVSLCVSL